MHGTSELHAGGTLERWDRTEALPLIGVPTLTIGNTRDTMARKHMQATACALRQGHCQPWPSGSPVTQHDEPMSFLQGLINFLQGVDAASASPRDGVGVGDVPHSRCPRAQRAPPGVLKFGNGRPIPVRRRPQD